LRFLQRFCNVVTALTRKDWSEYGKAVAILTVATAIPVVLRLRQDARPDFVRHMQYSFVIADGWFYAQSSFLNERLRKTIDYLLALPVDPFAVILAKHISVYTMVVVTMDVPMILLRDWHMLLLANAAAFLLATVVLGVSVLWEWPVAPQIPMLGLFALTFVTPDNLSTYFPEALHAYHWVFAHTYMLAVTALAICPLITLFTALQFRRYCRRWEGLSRDRIMYL